MSFHRSNLADVEKRKHELKLKRLKIIKGRNLKDLEKGKKEAEEHRNLQEPELKLRENHRRL